MFGSHFVAVLFEVGMGFGHTPVVVVGLALFVVGIVGLFVGHSCAPFVVVGHSCAPFVVVLLALEPLVGSYNVRVARMVGPCLFVFVPLVHPRALLYW